MIIGKYKVIITFASITFFEIKDVIGGNHYYFQAYNTEKTVEYEALLNSLLE